MFIRLVSVNFDPNKLEETRALCSSDEVDGVLGQLKGFQFRYLLESTDNPGEVIAITGWDSKADGNAYEQSGTFDELKDKFKQWFTSTPELKSYEVHSYLVKE
ncbi:antibiotic biosynthesis monooxygenase [Desulfobacterota bacterium AH_259_B03_O07]|nr:antibiotic biosynthesis monooxygenase [Desulfobacterota bacterium AH_259_B03_O07]